MAKMLINKFANQKYLHFLNDTWNTKLRSKNKSQQNNQKNNQKFIKISNEYNKSLNKDLNLRYWIDRIEQKNCIIGDYNKKVILPSFLQNLEFHCSGLSNKIFHHASFIHAWLGDSIGFSFLELVYCYYMAASETHNCERTVSSKYLLLKTVSY